MKIVVLCISTPTHVNVCMPSTYLPTKPDFPVLYRKIEVSTGILDLYEIYHVLEIIGDSAGELKKKSQHIPGQFQSD